MVLGQFEQCVVAETAAAYVSALDPDTVTTIDTLPELPRGRAERQQSLFPDTDSSPVL